MHRNHTRRFTVRHILGVLIGFSVLTYCAIAFLWRHDAQESFRFSMPHLPSPVEHRSHPIDVLLQNAESEFSEVLAQETLTLQAAAEAYRRKRGRHPPPKFDLWFELAQSYGAVVIESLFDRIYYDLTPFWGVLPKDMRDFARSFEHRISVRNGAANSTMNLGASASKDWMEAWLGLVNGVQHLLPDLDMALNVMDESRVIAPWEVVDSHVGTERETRNLPPKAETRQEYTTHGEDVGTSTNLEWIGSSAGSFWDVARVGCSPDSSARNLATSATFTSPPPLHPGFPEHAYHGYVQNWTLMKDPCQQPTLHELHGTFVEPLSISTTRKLVPIFGGSKLSMNNDILIPPAAYISETLAGGLYSGPNGHGHDWGKKIQGVVWRGVASGGRNRAENWTRFQRHRFVAMMNSTAVQEAEIDPDSPHQGANFVVPSSTTWNLTATTSVGLGSWISRIAEVGFTNLICFPSIGAATCNYTDLYFSLVPNIDMAKQLEYKFLPDIDGNSFSGRYLAFLRSTSVPIKSTIYSEWHDSRLIPWVHFIPMDNSFIDIYGILDYFLGTRRVVLSEDGRTIVNEGHDKEAKKIAQAGKDWAEKVLRKEDMQVYVLRLLLEYARLCDDDRANLGYVGDLPDDDG